MSETSVPGLSKPSTVIIFVTAAAIALWVLGYMFYLNGLTMTLYRICPDGSRIYVMSDGSYQLGASEKYRITNPDTVCAITYAK